MVAQRLAILGKLAWRLTRLRFSRDGDNTDYKSRRLLFDNFKYLGGVYVKFLQILALNVDFLKGWAGPSEFEIFESVPFENIDLATLLQAEIPNYAERFRMIEPEPFAAGTFAQVYRAELSDGTAVVLKVLRPTLVKNLAFDLRLLGLVARLSSWIYPKTVASVDEVYRQFAKTVRGETDYRRELKNAQWFYEYFKRSDEIVVPRTFADLSGSHVIVQEYVGGVSLAEVLSARRAGQDPQSYIRTQLGSDIWRQLEVVGSELLIATLTADFVLGDPHPGNIKLLPDNQVGLIDFGIAAPAPSNRQAFLGLIREYHKLYSETFDARSFTVAALQFFDEDLVDALRTAGQLYAPTDPESLLNRIGISATQALDGGIQNAQTQTLLQRKMMMQLFNRVINDHNRFGIKMNLDSAVMLKSATTYLSMVSSLATKGENFTTIRRALARAITVSETANLPLEPARAKVSPEQSLELLSSWLAKIADNDPFLYRQITANMAL